MRVPLVLIVSLLCAYGSAQNADPQEMFREAQEAQQNGNYAAAAEKYRQLTIMHPEVVAAHANLGVVLVQLGRYDEAISQYHIALTEAPDNPALRLNLGLAYYKKGDFPAAAAQFAALNKATPEDLRIGVLLGKCELQIGLVGQAIAVLEPLEKDHADNADLEWALATAYLRSGRNLDAANRFQKVADQTNLADAYQLAANTYLGLTYFDEARRDAEKVLQINRTSPKAHIVLGMIADFSADTQTAVKEYGKALQLDPKDLQAQIQYAGALLRAQQYEEARKQLNRTLSVDANAFGARYLLAQVEKAEGKSESAVQQLETVEKQSPDWLTPHVELAALYYKLKRPEDGEREKKIVDELRQKEQDRRGETQVISPQVPRQVLSPDLPRP
jgi:tetratricopeptide (TPR) repeat protein